MAGFGFNIGLDGHRIHPLTEHDAEEVAEGLKIIYGDARERMLKSVAKRMASGRLGYGWTARKTSEVLAAHSQLSRDLSQAARERESLLSGVIDRAYMTGSQQFYSDMRSILGNTVHISPNSAKAGYILADLNNSLNAAERRILRQFDDRYADIIGAVSAEMATGVMNTRQAVGEALQRFADQGITGFIDRGGHHWTLENYAEMAVLTAIERSTISGYVDTMQSYGYDLAVIDGHIGSCPICEAWEGVIVSVSGNDRDYPSLSEAEAAGCFHPRCMHGITTYYPGISHTPKGGFRNEPREMRQPSAQYTARSKLRYMERMIQKYRDRALVAQTAQQKAQASAKAKEWRAAAEKQRNAVSASESGYGLYSTGSNEVREAYVMSPEYVERFSGITGDPAVDRSIGEAAQKMLLHRSGTNYEDLALIDARTGEVLYTIRDSAVPNGVKYDDGILKALERAKSERRSLISVHNHPNNLPPSLDDGVSALMRGYRSGVVACHDGNIYSFTPASIPLTGRECDEVHDLLSQKIMNTGKIEEPWLTTLSQYGMVVTKR